MGWVLLIALWALEERKCHFSAKGITRKENRPVYLKKEALIFLMGPGLIHLESRGGMIPRFQQTMACNFSEPLVELMERMPDSRRCHRMVWDMVALSCRLCHRTSLMGRESCYVCCFDI